MNGLKRDLLPTFEQNGRLIESAFSPTRLNRKKTVVPIPMHDPSSYYKQTPLNDYNTNSLTKRCNSSSRLTSATKKVSLDGRKSSRSIQTEVEFQSILRIRPLSIEERGEKDLFDIPRDSDQTIRLHSPKERPHLSTNGRRQKELDMTAPTEYHFDAILDDSSTQEDAYNHVCGDGMALDVVAPLFNYYSDKEAKQHVIVSIGVSNSGKTYTMFGDRKHQEEGVVQRLFDDIFVTGTTILNKKIKHQRDLRNKSNLAIQLSMVHLHNDHIYDMLSTVDNHQHGLNNKEKIQTRRSSVLQKAALFESRPLHQNDAHLKELKIQTDRETQDFAINPTIITCQNPADARRILDEGLKNNTTTSTNLNKQSSRGHTIITIRPVLNHQAEEHDVIGDSITLIDLAGIERTKTSAVTGKAMRESVSINTSISAVLQCLRAINHIHGKNTSQSHNVKYDDVENMNPAQQNIITSKQTSRTSKHIPYRQNKLTMLLQPLFSGNFHGKSDIMTVKNTVKMLVSVYPGIKDYNEKKALLGEIDALRGLKTHITMERKIVSKKSDDTLVSEESSITSRIPPTSNIETEINYKDVAPPQKISNSSPLKRLVSKVKTSSSKKRKSEVVELLERIKTLEDDNNKMIESYQKIKRKCKDLKHDNDNLKSELEKSKQSEMKLRQKMEMGREETTSHVQIIEKSFHQSRDIRRRQQTLLSSPVRNHMKAVQATSAVFCGTLHGSMTTRPPFQLHIPSKDKKETASHDDDDSEKSSYSA